LTAPAVEGEDGLRHAVKSARDCGLAHKGDLIAIVSASPGKRAGATDTVRIVRA
jgi:pyruvate kinase